MAERGMSVIKGNLPKPNLSANDDLDRPRRIAPFRWLTKAELAQGVSMRAPKQKVRHSEHTRTDAEKRLQEPINTLTMANERIRAQSLAVESVLRDRNTALMRETVDEERKKNKAELKKISKELKDIKMLYRAEIEKVKELQRSVYQHNSTFKPSPQQPQPPKSTPDHGRTLSDFAETRSMAEATQESVFTVSAKMSGVKSILAKLTEVTAQALQKSKDTDKVTEIQRQKAEDARRDRAWRSYGGKFKTLKVRDICAMLDMRDTYLDVYDGEKEPNLWIHVDPELKQSLSNPGITKEELVKYLRKYMKELETYEGEDTPNTFAERVVWPHNGQFLESLNAEARFKVKLDAPELKFGDLLDEFNELIKSVYERKMDTMEDVDLTPPGITSVTPKESEVRRAHQRSHRGGKTKKRHSMSFDD
eukprot:augustus_masked-scaffold_10-processed-gene-5.65-mRNA-1 protein AED:1.00 eAED:1.00 QI:0/0/0/0/1/1/2/0/419